MIWFMQVRKTAFKVVCISVQKLSLKDKRMCNCSQHGEEEHACNLLPPSSICICGWVTIADDCGAYLINQPFDSSTNTLEITIRFVHVTCWVDDKQARRLMKTKALWRESGEVFLSLWWTSLLNLSISSISLGSEEENQWRMRLQICEMRWKGQQWNQLQNQIAIAVRDPDNLLMLRQ